MSSRVLRRLGEKEQKKKLSGLLEGLEHEIEETHNSGEEEECDDESERQSAFMEATFLLDDSEEESSEDIEVITMNKANPKLCSKQTTKMATTEQEESLDAILSEFRASNLNPGNNSDSDLNYNNQQETFSAAQFLLANLKVKNLDLDRVLREMLGGHAVGFANQPILGMAHQGRETCGLSSALSKRALFGKPRSHWTRPPTFTGGGIGMKIVCQREHSCNQDGVQDIEPMPYSSRSRGLDSPINVNPTLWFSFVYSDTYRRITRDFESNVQPSGDVNRLAIFVANHPFCTDALLQLAMVFYHTGEMEKGNELLRRALYVYESAFLSNFLEGIKHSQTTGYGISPHMDPTQLENRNFFVALFRLMQIAKMMGCVDTSFALSLLMLSLDPHRDLMGMLCCFLDYFALATVKDENNFFLVSLVQSNMVCEMRVKNTAPIPISQFSFFCLDFCL